MLNCILVGPSLGAVRALQMVCVEFEDLFIYKVLTAYPGLMELARLLNLFGTEIMFLELGNSDRPVVMAREVRGLHASTVVIGFVRDRCDEEMRQEAQGAGIAQILEPPFTPFALQEAVVRALQARCPGVANNVVAFLPGKPGSGASTLACNLAGALAQPLGQYVLLLDGDMNSGVVSTLLGLDPIHTVMDALESSHELNESMWRYRTGKAHGFDVLPMPKNRRGVAFPQWNYQRLLNFVRERYDLVLVDLPDVLNESNEAFITQAKMVYVVCTPDPPSLFLARRRVGELQSRGVEPDRVGVVVNRFHRRETPLGEIEAVLGVRVSVTLPDDPRGAREATVGSTLVSANTELGRGLRGFARVVAGVSPLADRQVPTPGLFELLRKRVLQDL